MLNKLGKNFISKGNFKFMKGITAINKLSCLSFKNNIINKNSKQLYTINSFQSKSFSDKTEELVKTSVPAERVGLIQLNRPKAKNALNNQINLELNQALYAFERDSNIAVIVLTGHTEFFAAGADIKEMKDLTFSDCYKSSFLDDRNYLSKVKKPVIGCVNGYAFGGGCEIAMMCDILIAGDNALFGQPEITIGTVPGMGGSQRLTKAIGKSRSMEMCLTGEPMKAQEALERGLVSKVYDKNESLNESINLAKKIAAKSSIISMAVKDVVNASFELNLQQGLDYEKRVFWSTFATEDRKLGMSNFVNKVKDYKFTDK